MNKIQVKGEEKIQRKRRTRAVALPQLAASKLSHKNTGYSQPDFAVGPGAATARRSQRKVSDVVLKTGTYEQRTTRAMAEPLDDHETSSRVERAASASDAAFGCTRGTDLRP
jgi:hypothetical protein